MLMWPALLGLRSHHLILPLMGFRTFISPAPHGISAKRELIYRERIG